MNFFPDRFGKISPFTVESRIPVEKGDVKNARNFTKSL